MYSNFVKNHKIDRELSGHSVVVVNQLHQIIACVCLRSYPNIPALLPEVWPEVFQTLYGTAEHSFENTLFVHMFLCDRRYNWDFLVRVFRTLFLCVFRLQYVVMVMPPAADQCKLNYIIECPKC